LYVVVAGFSAVRVRNLEIGIWNLECGKGNLELGKAEYGN
jgi:hypothetical protein